MALPVRGQADWDDELANHISGLEADVASAVANAEQARSNSITAIAIAEAAGEGGGGAVDSVNGETGVVVLTASDVGATPSAHASDETNPHAVTKSQVGLANVDNTADTAKPVSTAQAAADAAVQAAAVQRANHTGTQAQSTVTDLVADLAAKAPVRATINAQTGTTYTIVLADENKLVTLTNAGAITVTLPQDSSVAIPVGGRIDFAVLGAGMATFVAGTGATIAVADSAVTRKTNSAVSAYKVAANTWLIAGDLA